MKIQIVKNKLLRAVAIAMSAMVVTTSVPVASFAADGDEQPATPETAIEAVEKAEEEVTQHYEEITGEQSQSDQAVLSDLGEAKEALDQEVLNNQDLIIAIVESDNAEQKLDELEKTLDSVYLEHDNKDKAGADRKQYNIARDEDGNLDLDENNNPVFDGYEKVDQISGQYNSEYDNNKRSVQGVYQSGMDEIKKAIEASNKGDDETAKEHLANAENYLKAEKVKYGDTTNKLAEAVEQYNAASEAAEKAQDAYTKIEGQLGDAIKYCQEAQTALENAQKKSEQLDKIRDEYYKEMVEYFKNDAKTATYDENGNLNIKESADKARELNTRPVMKTEGMTQETFNLGRALLVDLVTYKLEDEGATDIQFGDEWLKVKNTKVNGRDTHIKVTYTDKNNQEQTKYYNYIIKAKADKYEGANVDFENGVIFVSEITSPDNGKTWVYTPYNKESSEYLDNYNTMLKAVDDYKDAKLAVAAAAAEVDRLKAELENLSGKVASNSTKCAELAAKLEKAQVAYANSTKSMKDFEDVYEQMYRNLYPDEIVVEPEEFDPEDGPITGPAENPSGTDETPSDDGADEGAGTPGTTNLPAIPAGNPAGAAAANTAGVLGVRADAGDQAADNAAIVNVADNKVALDATPDGSKKAATEDSKKGVKIANSETPLAATPFEEGMNPNYLWLLLVAAAIIAGVVAYERHKKKVEANATRN